MQKKKKTKRKTKKRTNKMKIIYIIGKSSVGKDTIYQILKKKMNLKTYVMYTTRPIRTGEKNGIDYYYLKQEEMEKYINLQTINNYFKKLIVKNNNVKNVYNIMSSEKYLNHRYKTDSSSTICNGLDIL